MRARSAQVLTKGLLYPIERTEEIWFAVSLQSCVVRFKLAACCKVFAFQTVAKPN